MAVLRVGFDTAPLHGQRTGIGQAVAALQAEIASRDDVELAPYLVSFRARPEPPTRRLPLPAAMAHRLWALAGIPRMDRFLDHPDVVHGTNYVVPPTKAPSIVSVYDCWFLRQPDQAAPAVVRAGRVLRAAVERGAVVHASSVATATAVRELLPGATVRTILLGALPLGPSGVDDDAAAGGGSRSRISAATDAAQAARSERAPIPEMQSHPFMLSIGTLERRKNLPRLIAAFGAIADHDPAIRLVLAGGHGDDTAAVRRSIDRLSSAAAPRVLLTGRVSDAQRAWLLAHAMLLAYPSLDEGFGFPLLDAMQVGVPIVASRAGSIPEVGGAAVEYCDAEDTDSIGAALHRVLNDADRRVALVNAGREQWPQFTWQRCAAEMVELYRDVAMGQVEAKA